MPASEGSHVEGEALRRVMRRVASPVTIVTAAGSGETRGITIGSFTSLSLDPPLISFNVDQSAQMHRVITAAERFAVHIVSDEQAHLCNHFAIPDLPGPEQFEPVTHHLNEHGTPILEDVVAVLHCRPYAFFEVSDHTIIVGEVLAIDPPSGREEPVLYYNRTYRSVGTEVRSSLFSPVKRASSSTS